MFNFITAFRSPDGRTRRFVFIRADKHDSFLVVKLFDKELPRTVKYWNGDLEKTIQQWRTSVEYTPTATELGLAINTVRELTPNNAAMRFGLPTRKAWIGHLRVAGEKDQQTVIEELRTLRKILTSE